MEIFVVLLGMLRKNNNSFYSDRCSVKYQYLYPPPQKQANNYLSCFIFLVTIFIKDIFTFYICYHIPLKNIKLLITHKKIRYSMSVCQKQVFIQSSKTSRATNRMAITHAKNVELPPGCSEILII